MKKTNEYKINQGKDGEFDLPDYEDEFVPELVVCRYCYGVTEHLFGFTSQCRNCGSPLTDTDVALAQE